MDATNNNFHSRRAANGITMLRGTVLVGLLMSSVLTSLPTTTFALERDDEGRHSLVQHPYSVRSLLTTLQTEVDVLKTQLSLLTGTNTSLQTALKTAQADIVTLQVRVKALEAKPSGGVPNLERYVTIDTNPINGVAGPHILITGANVHVRSGSGVTDDNVSGGGTLTGLGNLIIGYNESNPLWPTKNRFAQFGRRQLQQLQFSWWHGVWSSEHTQRGVCNHRQRRFQCRERGECKRARWERKYGKWSSCDRVRRLEQHGSKHELLLAASRRKTGRHRDNKLPDSSASAGFPTMGIRLIARSSF